MVMQQVSQRINWLVDIMVRRIELKVGKPAGKMCEREEIPEIGTITRGAGC